MVSQIYSACNKKKLPKLGKRHMRVTIKQPIDEKATNLEEQKRKFKKEQKRKLKEMIKRNM